MEVPTASRHPRAALGLEGREEASGEAGSLSKWMGCERSECAAAVRRQPERRVFSSFGCQERGKGVLGKWCEDGRVVEVNEEVRLGALRVLALWL